ncbi:formate dehydrogenase accessory protein FdhE [Aureimonas psammosilenae]|uniref:formate dehydrogenase accessory protein FdhE n=1 Tax=Aureimonas psammosilenae TaxID=2495496 RepID=UPI0012612A7D|nr:formate dehydrogenase accessory protein FdhE [Aureimonas psammosilenae]
MTGSPPLQPDPSAISGIAKAPFAFLPRPDRLFRGRADRFAVLAEGSRLQPYLRFLEAIARAQDAVVAETPEPEALPPSQVEQARAGAMPPMDRAALPFHPDMKPVLRLFLDKAEAIGKPAPAATALSALRGMGDEDLSERLTDAVSQETEPERAAELLYLSAATQILAARLAAPLDASRLVPVRAGLCPVCGARPLASFVVGVPGAEGVRYAVCSFCATHWNEVRVKCLACGSTQGIGYRSVEAEDAVIKAEICDTCHSWVKILYADRNPSLEPVADDVASLGLDLLMRDTDYRRAGFDPFLLGY